jgi:CRISPR-associated protein Cst1
MIYQLLNALSVKNKEKFMDIILRVYCSSKLSKNIVIPDAFINMLGNTELFQQYGYAFVLGLRGSHPTNTKEDKNISKNENTEEVIGNE